jgi:hypothetical protein
MGRHALPRQYDPPMEAIGRDYQRRPSPVRARIRDSARSSEAPRRARSVTSRYGPEMCVRFQGQKKRSGDDGETHAKWWSFQSVAGIVMATENIVLLGSAVVLCGLHVLGGPLSGLLGRNPRPKQRGTPEVFVRDSGAEKREIPEHV